MRKYQIIRNAGDITLVREGRKKREDGSLREDEVARFQLMAPEALIQNVALALSAGIEDGHTDIVLVQEATNGGRSAGITLTSERTGAEEGFAEIFVGVFRGQESLASVRIGIDESGGARLRIQSRRPDGSKREIDLALADPAPVEVVASPVAEPPKTLPDPVVEEPKVGVPVATIEAPKTESLSVPVPETAPETA